MIGVSVLILIGTCAGWSSAQFLNNRPYPTYSLEQMPDTGFTCRDKILGGYYADPETQCQMFHVCVKVAGVGVQDFRFLCPNGTAFDQDHQICADWEDVDCDATTLYYSSDNFDLYRIGSGFESKAVKYGEDEEPFSLQRAETGDIRLNREHQTQRINQQKESFGYKPKNQQQTHRSNNYNNNNDNYNNRGSNSNSNSNTNRNTNYNNNNNNEKDRNTNYNNNNNNNNNEKDIFKSSSSSNFFNNRNGGKETDEDEYDSGNVNANQNEDRFQRRKVIRKQNRRPDYEEDQTQKPSRPTGFANNFAGSSYIPTTARSVSTTLNNDQYTTAVNNHRGRPRNRGNPQYNNADNFRQRNYDDEGQYRETSNDKYDSHSQTPQYTVSTPAPFRQTQQYNNAGSNKQSSQYDSNNNNDRYNSNNGNSRYDSDNGKYDASKYDDGQYRPTTAAPRPTQRVTENYPSPFTKKQPTTNYNNNNNNQYSQQTEAENYPSTPFKKTENYPSTQKQTKETENYPTTSAFNNNNNNNNRNNQQQRQQYYENQYEVTKTKQTENYPTGSFNTQNSKKPTTPFKQPENYPTTFSPKTSPFKNPTYSESYSTTLAPRTNSGFTQTSQQTTQYSNKQNTQFSSSTNYNQQNSQRDYDNTRPSNTQSTYNQPQTNRQTTQYNPTTQQQKQTTQYTQYTPTVPRITTPYYTSTTTAAPIRRSNRFDETSYDDGSYDSRFESDDNRKNNKDDEFLKTAHSTNIASSRNEYLQSSTKNVAPVSSTQKPRPFSVTPNSPKVTDYTRANNNPSPSTQNSPRPAGNVSKPPPPPPPPAPVNNRNNNNNNNHSNQNNNNNNNNNNKNNNNSNKPVQSGKKTKDASYDYAYYDTNVGSEHEYDIGVDIEKADKSKNKKQ